MVTSSVYDMMVSVDSYMDVSNRPILGNKEVLLHMQ